MKLKIFKSTVLILLSFLATTSLKAQLYEVPLDEKIITSSLIIEGEVIESQPFKVGNDGFYTAHKIEIHKILKGTGFQDERVTVITMGGEVNGLKATWSNFLTLNEGEKGIFFLQPTVRPTIDAPEFPKYHFEVFASSQGFLKYTEIKGKTIAVEPFHQYENIENQVFKEIEVRTGETARTVKTETERLNEEAKKCIIFTFEPVIETALNPLKIGADIKVRSTDGDIPLYKSIVVLEYDTVFYGSNVVASGALEFEDGDISGLDAYNLVATDLAANKLEVKLDPVGSFGELFTLTEQKSFLARVYLKIANPLGDANVVFDYDAMEQGNLYYDPVLGQTKPFDCIEIENEVFPVVCPNIVSFSPDTLAAGAGDTLTIRGSDFGPITVDLPSVGSGVLLTQVQQGGAVGHNWITPFKSEYIFWSDTMIQVKVPSLGFDLAGGLSTAHTPGTGIVGIMRDGCIDSTAASLYVKFAAINQGIADPVTADPITVPTKLTSRNGDGGYDLYFTPAFQTFDTLATAAFNRALVTWRCATGVNFRIKDFATIPAAYQSNACKIDYGVMPAGIPATIVALTDLDSISFCGTSTNIWHAFLTEFSLIFSNAKTWHTTTDTIAIDWINTLDLETIALHELGHAHQLLHSNNTPNLMHNLANSYHRVIEADDLCGGLYIIQISSVDTAQFCQPAMQAVPFADCGDVSTGLFDIPNNDFDIEIFPNPTSGIINIKIGETVNMASENLKVTIFNSIGQKFFDSRLYTAFEQVNVQSLPNGIFICVLTIDGIPAKSFKILKY